MKHLFFIFYFIKSETSDSFVNHFDGHFAYLKTLDFYFKMYCPLIISEEKLLVWGHLNNVVGPPEKLNWKVAEG